MRKVLFAALVVAMLLIPASCIAPSDAEVGEPSVTIAIPGTDTELLVTPAILDKYAGGAKTAGAALPGPIGTIATLGGIALAGAAEAWRRRAKRKHKKDIDYTKVIVRAVDVLRTDPTIRARYKGAVGNVLENRGVDEGDFRAAVDALKEEVKHDKT